MYCTASNFLRMYHIELFTAESILNQELQCSKGTGFVIRYIGTPCHYAWTTIISLLSIWHREVWHHKRPSHLFFFRRHFFYVFLPPKNVLDTYNHQKEIRFIAATSQIYNRFGDESITNINMTEAELRPCIHKNESHMKYVSEKQIQEIGFDH